MAHEPRRFVRLASIALAAWLTAPAGVAAQSGQSLAGERLEDALRTLQARGLRVVFTSQLVTPEMRVLEEPKARAPKDVLDQLLAPHGLVARPGPAGVLLVTKQSAALAPGPAAPGAARPPGAVPRPAAHHEGATAYQERITVVAPLGLTDDAVGPERTLGATTLHEFGGQLADDPLRVVQTLPGVAASDDFSNELSVRGSAHRHATTVLDGVEAPWLSHGAFGHSDVGSLTMVRGEMVSALTLQVGAYPRRESEQLGPRLALTLRGITDGPRRPGGCEQREHHSGDRGSPGPVGPRVVDSRSATGSRRMADEPR